MKQIRWLAVAALAAGLAGGFQLLGPAGLGQNGQSHAQDKDWESKKIVPFVPTPQPVVDRMLELAEIKPRDVVYDLGSGDGRIVIAAARRYGVKAVGFEIDPDLVKESRENIKKAGVERLAEIREQDILTVNLSEATVLTMYLLPSVNLQLKPKVLSELRSGARVVSHAFDMGDWRPERVEQVKDASGISRTVYLWRIRNRAGR